VHTVQCTAQRKIPSNQHVLARPQLTHRIHTDALMHTRARTHATRNTHEHLCTRLNSAQTISTTSAECRQITVTELSNTSQCVIRSRTPSGQKQRTHILWYANTEVLGPRRAFNRVAPSTAV
jgi:hypothetical protein